MKNRTIFFLCKKEAKMTKVEKIGDSAYFVLDDPTKYIVDFSSNTDLTSVLEEGEFNEDKITYHIKIEYSEEKKDEMES